MESRIDDSVVRCDEVLDPIKAIPINFDNKIATNKLDNFYILSAFEKDFKNILVYEVAYKTPYGAKPLHFIFDEVYGYIKKISLINKYDYPFIPIIKKSGMIRMMIYI